MGSLPGPTSLAIQELKLISPTKPKSPVLFLSSCPCPKPTNTLDKFFKEPLKLRVFTILSGLAASSHMRHAARLGGADLAVNKGKLRLLKPRLLFLSELSVNISVCRQLLLRNLSTVTTIPKPYDALYTHIMVT